MNEKDQRASRQVVLDTLWETAIVREEIIGGADNRAGSINNGIRLIHVY